MLLVQCPQCRQGVEVPDGAANGERRCPHCRTAFPVSAHSTFSVPASNDLDGTVDAIAGRTEQAEPTLIGTEFSGYAVEAVLGRGGMGIVYRARQQLLKRTVALKMVRAGVGQGTQERQRFRSEAEALARLSHPHIVQIHEVGDFQGEPFISLEYVEGGSLAEQLRRKPLPPREIAALVETLARAVAAAHSAGIIHRDLKPSNVLLTPDGTPKITDFGLAKQSHVEGAASETRSGAILGTPAYMAPEQALGRVREVGPLADVYSLGAILYECLTGLPPFRGDGAMDVLLQVANDAPLPPTHLKHGVPADLETICLKCLRKEPARRYPSASALADDLRRWLNGQPIHARPAGRVERSIKWMRRHPAAAALLGTVAVALIALLAVGLYFTDQLRDERNHALSEKAEADRQRGLAVDAREKTRDEQQNTITQWNRAEAEKIQAAKDRDLALRKEREAQEQLDLSRRHRYTAQLWRVGNLWNTDPALARRLLHDPAVCPPIFRDFAWSYLDRLCRYERGAIYVPAANDEAIAFSPDGKLLATAANRLVVWDAATFAPVQELATSAEEIGNVLFLRDGTTLVSGASKGDNEGIIKLWNYKTGKEKKRLVGQPGKIGGIALHPKKNLLAVTSYREGKVTPWNSRTLLKGCLTIHDLDTGQQRSFLKDYQWGVTRPVFSGDGKYVAVGIARETQAMMWDVESGTSYATLTATGGSWADSLAFSADGKSFAIGSSNSNIYIWDVPSKKLKMTLAGHITEIGDVLFLDDNTLISAASGNDRTVRVWDLRSGRERIAYRELETPIAVMPNGRGLAARNSPWTIQLVDLPGKPELFTSPNLPEGVNVLAFAPDGKTLASAGPDRIVRLWGSGTGASLGALPAQPHPVTCLAFVPDSSLLITGGAADVDKKRVGRIALWEMPGRKQSALLTPAAPVLALAVSPNGRTLASAGKDGMIHFWDLASKAEAPVRQLRAGPWPGAIDLAFSPDGQVLAVAGGPLSLWNVADGSLRPALEQKGFTVDRVAFTPDGEFLLATSIAHSVVHRWDLVTGKELGNRAGHNPAGAPRRSTVQAHAVAFSPDCRTLAVGLVDRTVQLWDVDTGQQRAALSGHLREVNALAFSADGKLLASGSHNLANIAWIKGGEIKVWSTVRGPAPHATLLSTLALSPDARGILSADRNGGVKIWDALGKERFSLDAHHSVVTAAYSGDGRTVATLCDELAQFWDAQTGVLLDTLPAPGNVATPPTIAPIIRPTPDGRGFFALGTTLRVWNAETRKVELEAPLPTAYRYGALSHDRALLAGVTGANGEWLELFEVSTGKVRWRRQDGGPKLAPAFTPDGDLITGHFDGSIRIWDAATGEPRGKPLTGHQIDRSLWPSGIVGRLGSPSPLALATAILHEIRPIGPVRYLYLSPDGRTLASVADRRTADKLGWEVLVWDLPTRTLRRPPLIVPSINISLRFDPQGRLWFVTQEHGAISTVKEIP